MINIAILFIMLFVSSGALCHAVLSGSSTDDWYVNVTACERGPDDRCGTRNFTSRLLAAGVCHDLSPGEGAYAFKCEPKKAAMVTSFYGPSCSKRYKHLTQTLWCESYCGDTSTKTDCRESHLSLSTCPYDTKNFIALPPKDVFRQQPNLVNLTLGECNVRDYPSGKLSSLVKYEVGVRVSHATCSMGTPSKYYDMGQGVEDLNSPEGSCHLLRWPWKYTYDVRCVRKV